MIAHRVLVVWSKQAVLSDYVRAEIHVAKTRGKHLVFYMTSGAPPAPPCADLVLRNEADLKRACMGWIDSDDLPHGQAERDQMLHRRFEENEGLPIRPLPSANEYGPRVGRTDSRMAPRGSREAKLLEEAYKTGGPFTEVFGKTWRVIEFRFQQEKGPKFPNLGFVVAKMMRVA